MANNMPRYRCHKEVSALKIKEVRREEMPRFTRATCRGSLMLQSACGHCERCHWEQAHGPTMSTFLIPEDQAYPLIVVDAKFMAAHHPEPGGYYVVYQDGYASYSPAGAFESGYTAIDGEASDGEPGPHFFYEFGCIVLSEVSDWIKPDGYESYEIRMKNGRVHIVGAPVFDEFLWSYLERVDRQVGGLHTATATATVTGVAGGGPIGPIAWQLDACTRGLNHDGPCNGFPSGVCSEASRKGFAEAMQRERWQELRYRIAETFSR